MKKKKKKKKGHYCWVCKSYRPNEKFSGRGHARHICRDCQREAKSARKQKRKQKKAETLPNCDGN